MVPSTIDHGAIVIETVRVCYFLFVSIWSLGPQIEGEGKKYKVVSALLYSVSWNCLFYDFIDFQMFGTEVKKKGEKKSSSNRIMSIDYCFIIFGLLTKL